MLLTPASHRGGKRMKVSHHTVLGEWRGSYPELAERCVGVYQAAHLPTAPPGRGPPQGGQTGCRQTRSSAAWGGLWREQKSVNTGPCKGGRVAQLGWLMAFHLKLEVGLQLQADKCVPVTTCSVCIPMCRRQNLVRCVCYGKNQLTGITLQHSMKFNN